MSNSFPVRIRTFLVPLAGVALYYFVQFAALAICALIFQDEDSVSLVTDHYGSFIFITSVLMMACLFVWLFIFDRTYKNTIKRDIVPPGQLLISIPMALAMLGLINLYMIGIQTLSEYFPSIKDMLNEYIRNVSMPNTVRGFEAAGYYIGVGILVPVVEEILFRGIILGEFLSTMKPNIAVFLSALIFGTMHMQPIQIGYACICGVILGYVYLYSGSLVMPIAIHIIFNVLGGILPVAFADRQDTLYILGIIEIIFIFVGVLCVLYLKKNYRNKMIREV